jgi:TonB family protein
MVVKLSAIALVLLVGPPSGIPQNSRLVGVSEWLIRGNAVDAPKPAYPTASIASGAEGVAVAAVAFSPEGQVISVVVLESPDESIGTAMREALLRWRFSPVWFPGQDGAWVAGGGRGRLTFYFDILDGAGRVRGADEMPGARVPPRRRDAGDPFQPPAAPPPPPPSARPPGGVSASAGAPTASSRHNDTAPIVHAAELAEMLKTSKPFFLDARDRSAFRLGHRDGAINIPVEELVVRGPIELPSDRPIVIDCYDLEWRCQAYASRVEAFASRVVILMSGGDIPGP